MAEKLITKSFERLLDKGKHRGFITYEELGKSLGKRNSTTENIEKALIDFKNRIKISLVPNITNICYGRGVGYKIEEIVLAKEVQEISATKIRKKMREEGKLK